MPDPENPSSPIAAPRKTTKEHEAQCRTQKNHKPQLPPPEKSRKPMKHNAGPRKTIIPNCRPQKNHERPRSTLPPPEKPRTQIAAPRKPMNTTPDPEKSWILIAASRNTTRTHQAHCRTQKNHHPNLPAPEKPRKKMPESGNPKTQNATPRETTCSCSL